MLPGDLYLCFEHDLINVLVQLKCLANDFLIFARIEVADHVEEFANVGDD
jgi:hypothetical protein